MTVAATTALAVAGSDTDARTYTTASWTPTPGTVYSLALGVHDLGGQPVPGGWPTPSGNNITWQRIGEDVGGSSTEPIFAVWSGVATTFATAGAITWTDLGPVGGTVDGVIWGMVGFSSVAYNSTDRGFVQSNRASTNVDTVTVTLSAFSSSANAAGAWVLAYDNAGGAITFTAGSGFSFVTQASQASGGDTMRLGFEFRNTNDTSVDVTASASNDRLLMHAVEIRDGFALDYPKIIMLNKN